jgi:hypothetical protein
VGEEIFGVSLYRLPDKRGEVEEVEQIRAAIIVEIGVE